MRLIVPVPAVPAAVGEPGKLADAPVIVLQLVPPTDVATVWEVATVPVPTDPVQPENTSEPFVPVLLAEVVNSTIRDDAPPEFMFVKITELLVKYVVAKTNGASARLAIINVSIVKTEPSRTGVLLLNSLLCMTLA